MKRFTLYLMNIKGYTVLRDFVERFSAEGIESVIASRDAHLVDDYYDKMRGFCEQNDVAFCDRKDPAPAKPAAYAFAVGWRWLIDTEAELVVTHDSLLPRYRGFAPLVNHLINGEGSIGVSALFAAAEYDRGAVLAQRSIAIDYPIKISEAIEKIRPLFSETVLEVAAKIIEGKALVGTAQDESKATYSLWRNEDDYRIDWTRDAAAIRRMIDAVGSPYKGAKTVAKGRVVRVLDAEEVKDVIIENRDPGKVIFVEDGCPVVVCGKGLLKLKAAEDDEARTSCLPFPSFRIRFS